MDTHYAVLLTKWETDTEENMNERSGLVRKTSEIVNRYRLSKGENGKHLSFAQFAWELCRPARDKGIKIRISAQAVKNWADGEHCPDYLLITRLYHCSPPGSWQHGFSEKILSEYRRVYGF